MAAARINAARAEIRQVVSYVTLHNVSFETGLGAPASYNQVRLYNPSNAVVTPQQSLPTPPPPPQFSLLDSPLASAGHQDALDAVATSLAPGFNLTLLATEPPVAGLVLSMQDFTLMWLSVFLAIPLLLFLLFLCLCLNRRDDKLNKAQLYSDCESGGSGGSGGEVFPPAERTRLKE